MVVTNIVLPLIQYGGSLENRAPFILEIINAIKARLPSEKFVIAAKLNCHDCTDVPAFSTAVLFCLMTNCTDHIQSLQAAPVSPSSASSSSGLKTPEWISSTSLAGLLPLPRGEAIS